MLAFIVLAVGWGLCGYYNYKVVQDHPDMLEEALEAKGIEMDHPDAELTTKIICYTMGPVAIIAGFIGSLAGITKKG